MEGARVLRAGKLALLILGLFWIVLQVVAFVLVRQERLLVRVETAVRQSLARSYGLQIETGGLRPGPGFGVQIIGLRVRDLRQPDHALILSLAHAYLRLNPIRLAAAFKHPESAVSEILLDRPILRVARGRDRSWIWDRFRSAGGRNYFTPVITIHDAAIHLADSPLPHPAGDLTLADAGVDLRDYPRVRFKVSAATDLDPGMSLTAGGGYDLASGCGQVRVEWKDLTPARWQAQGWFPADRVQVRRGRLSGRLRIALGKEIIFRDGSATLSDGLIESDLFPGLPAAVSGELALDGRRIALSGLDVRTSRSTFSIAGSIDLAGRIPSLNGKIKLARLDLGEFSGRLPLPGGSSVSGLVSGWVGLAGPVDSLAWDGRISMVDGTVTYDGLRAERVGLRGRFQGRDFIADAFQAETAKGIVAGSGRWSLAARSDLSADFTARGIEAGAILAWLGLRDWRATADARGRLIVRDGRTSLDASLDWRAASWRERALPDGGGSFTCAADTSGARVDGGGRFGAGSFSLQGTLAGRRWEGRARLENVDLAPVASFLPGAGEAAGVAEAELRGHGGDGPAEIVCAVKIGGIRYAGLQLGEFQGSLLWDGTGIEIETGQARLGEASATIRGRLDPYRRNYAGEVNFHRVPLAMFPGNLGGDAEGSLAVSGRIEGPVSGGGWAHLKGLVWHGVSLGTGDFQFELSETGLSITRGRLESPEGHLDLGGIIGLAGRRELNLALTNLEWAADAWTPLLPGEPRLHGQAAGEAHLSGTFARPIAAARVQVGPGQAYGFGWQGISAVLRWQDRLFLEQGSIDAAGAKISLAGSVGADGWDLTAQAAGYDLASLADILPPYPLLEGGIKGKANFRGRVTGPIGQPVLAGDLEVAGPAAGRFACERLAGGFRFDGRSLSLTGMKASAGEQEYTADGSVDFSGRTMRLDLGVNRGDLGTLISWTGLPPPWTVQGLASGRVLLSGSLNDPAARAIFRIEDGELDGERIAGELDLSFAHRAVEIHRLRLEGEAGMISGAGRLAAGDYQIDLQADQLSLAPLAKLAGLQEKARGRGSLRLTMNRTGASISGRFLAEIGPGASYAGIPLDRAAAWGKIEDRGIGIDRLELVSQGHSLTASGRLPLPKDLGVLSPLFTGTTPGGDHLALDIETSGLPLPLLNPVLSGGIAFTGGRLDLDAEVAGTWDKPAIEGKMVLTGGAGRTTLLPDPFTDLAAEIDFSRQTLTVVSANARVGGGSLAMTGTVALTPGGPSYNLSVHGKRIAYKNINFDIRSADGDLTVAGGPLPAVSGTVTLSETRITVGVGPPGPPLPAVKLDVRVTAGRNVRFFLPGVADIPAAGTVLVRGDLNAPTVSGTASSEQGMVNIYGERFDVTKVTAVFTDDRGYLPYIDLEGRTDVRDIQVFVKVTGEVTDAGLSIRLWTDPPRSQQEILELMRWDAIPDADGDGSASDATSLLMGGFELVMDAVFSQLSEDFRRLIDADRLRLGMDSASGNLSLEMGKFVLKNLFVSYKIEFDAYATRTWEIDYRLSPRLVLSGVFSSTDKPAISMSYEFRFR